MNSECNAAICVKRTGESRSGQSSKSSDIHNGSPDDESFFFESEIALVTKSPNSMMISFPIRCIMCYEDERKLKK